MILRQNNTIWAKFFGVSESNLQLISE